MKKLVKMNINSEKVIKNEELMFLKGGSLNDCNWCLCNCNVIIEAWSDYYCSVESMINAIAEHCNNRNGSCSAY